MLNKRYVFGALMFCAPLAYAEDSIPVDKFSGQAEDSTKVEAPIAQLNESAPEDNPWLPTGFIVSANHFMGFRDDVDPFTVLDLGGNWKGKRYSFSFSQKLTKLYSVAKGDSEFQLADTSLGINRKFADPLYEFDLVISAGLTLPVSDFSRRQHVRTKPRAGISATRSFFDKTLSYSLGLGYQYLVSEYKTTRTYRGANGGSPLRESVFSVDNALSYTLSKGLTASLSLSYVKLRYYDIGYKSRVSNSKPSDFLSTDYSTGLNLGYAVSEHLALNVGYAQGDTVEKTGGIQEAYLFDEYSSQWYLGFGSFF